MKLSKCCGSEVAIGGEGTTHYYYCLKCNKACDTIEQPEQADFIEEKMKEVKQSEWFLNISDSVNDPDFEKQEECLNFIRQSITQQKEAIEKEWREKIKRIGDLDIDDREKLFKIYDLLR